VRRGPAREQRRVDGVHVGAGAGAAVAEGDGERRNWER
jgi:hypothetical protein